MTHKLIGFLLMRVWCIIIVAVLQLKIGGFHGFLFASISNSLSMVAISYLEGTIK